MFKEITNKGNLKSFMVIGLVAAMTATLFAGCGSKGNRSLLIPHRNQTALGRWSQVFIQTLYWSKLQQDLRHTINVQPQNRYDTDDYVAERTGNLIRVEDFNKEYPNIKVEINTDTNYADDALAVNLQSGTA